MDKKISITELNIPIDDVECWNRYPRHRWVYDLSRLLDFQNIKWCPFGTLPHRAVNMFVESVNPVTYIPAYIYINAPIGKQICTEVYIIKGEIKYMRYVDKFTKEVVTDLVGDVELRINAFVTMHFQKFTGIITTETVGSDIYAIRLRPITDMSLQSNAAIERLTKRIYKKNDVVHINGLADQALHESLVS
jgi:hypothetical protein